MKRPSWDEYFMELAHHAKTRSTCLRRQIGAVIVKDKHVLSTGYNGSPKNCSHCKDVGCLREKLNVPSGEKHELCRAIHSEQNAILQAARHGVSVNGSTIYTTTQPCSMCAKSIINAGIIRVVYEGDYPDEMSLGFLNEAGIIVERYEKKKDE